MWYKLYNKKSMRHHKTNLCNVSPEEAGTLAGEMEYNALMRFVMALSNKLAADGLEQAKEGQTEIAAALKESSISAYNTGRKIELISKAKRN